MGKLSVFWKITGGLSAETEISGGGERAFTGSPETRVGVASGLAVAPKVASAPRGHCRPRLPCYPGSIPAAVPQVPHSLQTHASQFLRTRINPELPPNDCGQAHCRILRTPLPKIRRPHQGAWTMLGPQLHGTAEPP